MTKTMTLYVVSKLVWNWLPAFVIISQLAIQTNFYDFQEVLVNIFVDKKVR